MNCIHKPKSIFPKQILVALCSMTICLFSSPLISQASTDDKGDTSPTHEMDVWYRVSIAEKPVGRIHLTSKASKLDDGSKVMEHKSDFFMRLNRDGDVAEVKESSLLVEDADGNLLRFQVNQEMGENEVVIKGVSRGGELHITNSSDDSKRSIEIDESWLSNVQQFDLISDLYKQYQKDTDAKPESIYSAFDAQIMSAVKVTITIKGISDTGLEKPWDKGLHVIMKQEIQGGTINSTNWFASDGSLLKSVIPGFGMTMERVKKEDAIKQSSDTVDINGLTSVQASGQVDLLNDASHTFRISVRRDESIPLKDDNWKILKNGPNQILNQVMEKLRSTSITTFSSIGDSSVSLTKASHPKPAAACLKRSSLIQSDADEIKSLARKHKKENPLATAKALEVEVSRLITDANYENVFDSALTVLEKKEGDCTEHSVLLVALCRAVDIPARVATGLIGVQAPASDEPVVQFFHHMWTEVYVDGNWHSLDATLGRGGITSAHIKLSDSSLADGDESGLISIVNLLGRIEIEVVR